MITGKTKSGFKFKVDERVTVDARFLDAVIDSADQTADTLTQIKALKVIRGMLLGEQGVADLRKHIADEDGYVSQERELEELMEIMQKVDKTKKS